MFLVTQGNGKRRENRLEKKGQVYPGVRGSVRRRGDRGEKGELVAIIFSLSLSHGGRREKRNKRS